MKYKIQEEETLDWTFLSRTRAGPELPWPSQEHFEEMLSLKAQSLLSSLGRRASTEEPLLGEREKEDKSGWTMSEKG